MNTYIQILDFCIYFIVGMLLTLVFDIFRAFRKYKKVKNSNVLVLQDLLYFIIAAIVILLVAIYLFKDTIRGYLFISIFLGISFYIKYISKYVIRFCIEYFKVSYNIFKFIILPLNVFFSGIYKIFDYFKKVLKNTCKKIKNVIFYNCKYFKNIVKRKKK